MPGFAYHWHTIRRKAIGLNSESFSRNGGEKPTRGKTSSFLRAWRKISRWPDLSKGVKCSPLASKIHNSLNGSCLQRFICRCSHQLGFHGVPSPWQLWNQHGIGRRKKEAAGWERGAATRCHRRPCVKVPLRPPGLAAQSDCGLPSLWRLLYHLLRPGGPWKSR